MALISMALNNSSLNKMSRILDNLVVQDKYAIQGTFSVFMVVSI